MTDRSRRTLLKAGAAAFAVGPALGAFPQGGSWPRGVVHLVVPFTPGGSVDAAARMMGERLTSMWGGAATVVVENRPGANTVIGAQAVLSGPRDGSAFLVTIPTTLRLPYLMQRVPFAPLEDFIPVAPMTVQQLVLVANPHVNLRSITEVSRALAAGKRLSFASYGTGTSAHLMQAEMSKAAGGEVLHVPYKGAVEAILATIAGDTSFTLAGVGATRPHLESGKLVAIAVTGDHRSPFMPQVQTLSEFGLKSFDAPNWMGVFAAKGTPDAVILKMAADMRVALKSPELVARLKVEGQEPGEMSVPEFQSMVKLDTLNGGRMLVAAGVKPE